jgi:putative ABC transport system substrate-binding protein
MKAASASPRVLASIVLFAGLLGACSGASGDSPTPQPIPRVGLMHVGTDHNPPSLGTLVSRLSELGWFDGSRDAVMRELVGDGTTKVQGKMAQLQGEFDGPRIDLIWRNLETSQTDQQAKDLVNQHVDVIVAFEDKSIRAAQDATAQPGNQIPVVFLHPSDPVRDGLVESLSHPGGNLTGVFGARDPVAKQLELYKEIMPGVRRLLTLVDPTDAATPPLLAQASDAAQQLGITLVMQNASDQAELQRAFQSLTPGEVDGAFLLSPSLRLNFSQAAIDLAIAANLPIQAHRKEWVKYGALFSLGVDVGPVGAAGARFVDAILKGTPPADLPVEEVPRVEFALNLKRAGELGIEVAQDVLDRVDVVYR